MKKIAILIPKGDIMPSGVISPYLLLTQINKFLQAQYQQPVFEVCVLGYEENQNLYDDVFFVQTHGTFREAKEVDLVIIPGFLGDLSKAVELNGELISWLRSQYLEHHTELASLCTGAFLIAATGLINEKKCTTHWAFAGDFQKMFPHIPLMAENIVTDENGIYTSAGAYSSLNLLLYLIEKFCGKMMAVWCSKVFQIDMNRNSQKPFVIFSQQKQHTDHLIIEVQEYIEKNFEKDFSIESLAEKYAFSRRNFIRRFKKATGCTPIEYIQRVRIEAAKRMLENTQKSVSEVVGDSGYQDDKAFRKLFKKYTGLTPSIYRNKYSHT